MKLKIGVAADAIPPTVDGIANVVDNYAKYITKNHGEAIMMTPRNPNQKGCAYPYQVYNYRSWCYLPMLKEGYRIGWPFKDYIREEVRAFHCDLYHSHCPLASSYLIKLALLEQKVPYVLTYHTKYEYDIEKRVPTKWAKNFAKNFIRKLIDLADEVWVPSEGTADSLRKMGYTGDYVVMPNGVDLPKGQASENEIQAFIRKYALKKNTPTLLFVGRMMWYKNISLIVEACRKLKQEGVDYQLVLAGSGPDFNSIQRKIKRMGLSDRVIFTGKITDREELRACYSASDLFLFPSTFDTNGLVVHEAAACMCPSILVKGSCAAEGIEEGFTGLLCEESADGLAAKIKEALTDRKQLAQIGQNAYNHIYLSWEDAVDMAYKRYEQICENWEYENK